MTHNPVISVIFPLPDYRGYLDEILESWIHGQTLDPESYEFLLVSGPTDAEKLEGLRPRLRNHDEAWVEEEDGILYLMDCAARRARGDVLILTESHCFAHPECLEKIAGHFSNAMVKLAQCFHINILETRFAEMEQRLEGIMIGFPEEPYWNYVRKRGFAIRKELYHSTGGFEHRFGYFSERAYAYRLFKNGHCSEFLREAVVYHYNTPNLEMMRPHHEDYAEGMCLYRETMPSREAEEAFGRFSLWDEREWFRFDSRMTVLVAVSRSWLGCGLPNARRFFGFVCRSLGSIQVIKAANECRTIFASLMATLCPGAEGQAYHYYRSYWKGIVKRVHLRTIQSELQSSQSRSEQPRDGRCVWEASALTDLPHWGLHGLESVDGVEFRWSEPIAFIRIPSSGSSRVEMILRLHSAGPSFEVCGFDLRLKGESVLEQGSWDDGNRRWRGVIDSGDGELFLTFISWKNLRFPGDERRLGVAIESLEIRPVVS